MNTALISGLRKLIAKKIIRQLATVVVLLVTIGLFIRFFMQHPQYLHDLGRTNPWWIILIVILNIPLLMSLVLIYDACLRLCGKTLPLKERFMLTSYSSIINFFGPLQSGPGVRAVYLKTRHQIRIRDYTLATLLYYGIFAFFNALFLLVGTRPWWQTVLVLGAVAGLSWAVISRFQRRDKQQSSSQFSLHRQALIMLVVATFLQVSLTAVNYFIELHAVHHHVSLGQALSYSGAANFALFVSLTPGAIGFRESFLYFSQHLHHVSTAGIVAANVIDRGAYVIFLLLLFVLMLSMHAKDRLQVNKLRRQAASEQ